MPTFDVFILSKQMKDALKTIEKFNKASTFDFVLFMKNANNKNIQEMIKMM